MCVFTPPSLLTPSIWLPPKISGSRIGALLDQLTDRLSSCLLLLVLSHIYPAYHHWCVGFIALDIASHWLQFYSTLACGRTSHKQVRNWLLQMYYTTHLLLIECCAQEIFLVGAYMAYFVGCSGAGLHDSGECPVTATVPLAGWMNGWFWESCWFWAAAGFLLKQWISVVQLSEAVSNIVALDVEKPVLVEGFTWKG